MSKCHILDREVAITSYNTLDCFPCCLVEARELRRDRCIFVCPAGENEWRIELKIPAAVRRLHMPLSGDPVRFTVKLAALEHEVRGVYQFRRGHSSVILDDAGGEWEVQGMWQLKKL